MELWLYTHNHVTSAIWTGILKHHVTNESKQNFPSSISLRMSVTCIDFYILECMYVTGSHLGTILYHTQDIC